MGLRNQLRDIYWQFKGIFLKGQECRLKKLGPYKQIIFICKGNICRSAFAEAYALSLGRNIIDRRDITITSGGVEVKKSIPPPDGAILAAKVLGVDIARHRSRPITSDMLSPYSIIIAMEWTHIKIMRHRVNSNQEMVTIAPLAAFDINSKSMLGFDRFNIRDPYGKSHEEFIDCFERVSRCILTLFSSLQG